MADLLELQTNRPEIVALAYTDGKEFPSKIPGAPAQVMFTLVDGRRVFWPKPFAESIRDAGIQANMPIEVTKREMSKGKTQLQFRPVPQQQERPAYQPAQTVERIYTAPATRTTPAPVAIAQPAAAAPVNTTTARLCAALCSAIDAAAEAQGYAERHGMNLEFQTEDIRALAITAFIEASKGGR